MEALALKNFDRFDTSSLRYVITAGKPYLGAADFHKQIYLHWHEFWEEQYRDYGSHLKLDPMDFYRQDFFQAIFSNDEIVATHSITGFSTQSYLEPYSYFSVMHYADFVSDLERMDVVDFAALQFFMVNDKFSPKKTGLNLGAIMLGLSLELCKYLQFDAAVSAARSDVAALNVAKKFNFIELSGKHNVHNVPVVSIVCKNPRSYPRAQERDLTSLLWQNRINLTEKGSSDEIVRTARL